MAHRLGGVIPEPTPTPTLEGTWVLNDTLVAPENTTTWTGMCVGTPTTGAAFNIITINVLAEQVNFYKERGTGGQYYFSTNMWDSNFSKIASLTFPTGATASDEFRAWLASNATKQ